MNHCLITGGSGFIGSHLARLLPEADILDWKNSSLEDIRHCHLEGKYDFIFHLAAIRSIPMVEADPKLAVEVNCLGIVNLIKAFPHARIINISSSSVNDVRSIYGATKAFGEMIGNLQKNCLNVRLYNVFGEGQPFESGAVVPQFVKAKLEGTKPIIYGDGSQERDFTYVGDVVEELKRLMFETRETGLMHVGYSKPMSVLDLCHSICGNIEIDFRPKRHFDIEYSSSIHSMRIKYGREEGLKRTIASYETAQSRI